MNKDTILALIDAEITPYAKRAEQWQELMAFYRDDPQNFKQYSWQFAADNSVIQALRDLRVRVDGLPV